MYLAVYGDEFLQKVDEIWGDDGISCLKSVWCLIATLGRRKLKLCREKEALLEIKDVSMTRANSYQS